MRYLLNGIIVLNGQDYYRVDDTNRMSEEMGKGTFNAVENMKRSGILINTHNVTAKQAQKIVAEINKIFV